MFSLCKYLTNKGKNDRPILQLAAIRRHKYSQPSLYWWVLFQLFWNCHAFSHRHTFIKGSSVSYMSLPAHRIRLTHMQLNTTMKGVAHQGSGSYLFQNVLSTYWVGIHKWHRSRMVRPSRLNQAVTFPFLSLSAEVEGRIACVRVHETASRRWRGSGPSSQKNVWAHIVLLEDKIGVREGRERGVSLGMRRGLRS